MIHWLTDDTPCKQLLFPFTTGLFSHCFPSHGLFPISISGVSHQAMTVIKQIETCNRVHNHQHLVISETFTTRANYYCSLYMIHPFRVIHHTEPYYMHISKLHCLPYTASHSRTYIDKLQSLPQRMPQSILIKTCYCHKPSAKPNRKKTEVISQKTFTSSQKPFTRRHDPFTSHHKPSAFSQKPVTQGLSL